MKLFKKTNTSLIIGVLAGFCLTFAFGVSAATYIRSRQLAPSPVDTYILATDGVDNAWIDPSTLSTGGGSVDLQGAYDNSGSNAKEIAIDDGELKITEDSASTRIFDLIFKNNVSGFFSYFWEDINTNGAFENDELRFSFHSDGDFYAKSGVESESDIVTNGGNVISASGDVIAPQGDMIAGDATHEGGFISYGLNSGNYLKWQAPTAVAYQQRIMQPSILLPTDQYLVKYEVDSGIVTLGEVDPATLADSFTVLFSNTDTVDSYLQNKIVAGTGISIGSTTDGTYDQQMVINADAVPETFHWSIPNIMLGALPADSPFNGSSQQSLGGAQVATRTGTITTYGYYVSNWTPQGTADVIEIKLVINGSTADSFNVNQPGGSPGFTAGWQNTSCSEAIAEGDTVLVTIEKTTINLPEDTVAVRAASAG